MSNIKNPVGAIVNEGASCTKCNGSGSLSEYLTDGTWSHMECWVCAGTGKDAVVIYGAENGKS